MGELLQNIQSQSANLNAGDISLIGFANHPAVAKFLFFFKIGIYLVIAAGLFYLIYKVWLQYKVKITIYSRIGGGGLETKIDRARIITDNEGRTKLQILKTRKGKNRITCPVPPSVFKTKIGKADHYNLWLDDNFQVHPIHPPIIEDSAYFKVIPEERKAWSRQERRQIENQYKNTSFLDKYLPSMIVLSAFMVAFLIFFFMSKDLAASLSSLSGEFGRVADACLQLKG